MLIVILLDAKSPNCRDETFVISPNYGHLAGVVPCCSGNKTVLHIYFTPDAPETYFATCLVEGVLGEDKQSVQLYGRGTHDGRFETLTI